MRLQKLADWLFIIAAVLTLTGAVTLALLTWRTSHGMELLTISSSHARTHLYLVDGVVMVDWAVARDKFRPYFTRVTSTQPLSVPPARFHWTMHLEPPRGQVHVPAWALIALLATCPAGWAGRRWRGRPVVGICARCGYDLRATPERCPECGEPVAKPTPHNPPMHRTGPAV